jgi:hypothetical protein
MEARCTVCEKRPRLAGQVICQECTKWGPPAKGTARTPRVCDVCRKPISGSAVSIPGGKLECSKCNARLRKLARARLS